MKDIDFDELDKAVNSLMSSKAGQAVTQVPQNDTTKDKVVEIATSDTDKTTPGLMSNQPKPASDASQSTESSERVSLPKRRSGRFMDVVHPSSDMTTDMRTHTKTSIKPPEDAKDASRASVSTQQGTDKGVDDNPESRQEKSFDPLDYPTSFNSSPADSPEETDTSDNMKPKTPDGDNELVDIDTTNLDNEPKQPLTDTTNDETPPASPFLATAKVDKRPLNSAALLVDTETESIASTVTPEEKPTVEPQPVELGSEILAIESDQSPTQPLAETNDTPEASDDKPNFKGVTTTPAPKNIETSSIVPQYKEKPTSEPPEHEAIYDGAAAQPLAHPTKKKSGWLVVVLIIGLLVLGAGGGALLYAMNIL